MHKLNCLIFTFENRCQMIIMTDVSLVFLTIESVSREKQHNFYNYLHIIYDMKDIITKNIIFLHIYNSKNQSV